MSYKRLAIILYITIAVVIISSGLNLFVALTHAQYYEDDCYSDDVYGSYYGENTVIVDEYDVYDGYGGYSSYDARSGIVDHYDIERGYSGFSTVDRRTGMVDHYDVELGYTGYSQIYLGR